MDTTGRLSLSMCASMLYAWIHVCGSQSLMSKWICNQSMRQVKWDLNKRCNGIPNSKSNQNCWLILQPNTHDSLSTLKMKHCVESLTQHSLVVCLALTPISAGKLWINYFLNPLMRTLFCENTFFQFWWANTLLFFFFYLEEFTTSLWTISGHSLDVKCLNSNKTTRKTSECWCRAEKNSKQQ